MAGGVGSLALLILASASHIYRSTHNDVKGSTNYSPEQENRYTPGSRGSGHA